MSALSDRIASHEAAMLEGVKEKRESKAELEKCISCGSDRILRIAAHSSDLNTVIFKDERKDGYLPDVKGICGGDDVDISVCLECGQVQCDFPVSNDSLVEYFGIEDYEDDIPY